MTKIGVNIGDEFPIDDGKPREDKERSGNEGGEDRAAKDGRCRGGRGDRDHSREWRHGWREHHGYDHHRHWRSLGARKLLPALIIIGGIALLIAIISHFFYFIVGAAVLAGLFAMYRNHHFDDWDMRPRSPSSGQQ